MSTDYHFYVEHRVGDDPEGESWACLPELVKVRPGSDPIAEELFWLSGRSPLTELFFRDDSPVTFCPGLPAAAPSLEVSRWLPGWGRWWVGFDDLLADYWDATRVVASGEVRRCDVDCFGDGTGPYPHDQMLEREAIRQAVVWERDRWYKIVPSGKTVDRRYEFSWNAEDELVDVTWTCSIAELLGAESVGAVAVLRRRWSDEDLRFVVILW